MLINTVVQKLILLPLTIAIVPTYASIVQKVKEDTCAGPIYEGKEVTRRAKVKKVTEPTYKEEARAKGVQGTVVLTGVFCRGGKVTNIEVVHRLPYGLTENAIETTRRIEFQPAEKDGESVSQRFRRECTFSAFLMPRHIQQALAPDSVEARVSSNLILKLSEFARR